MRPLSRSWKNATRYSRAGEPDALFNMRGARMGELREAVMVDFVRTPFGRASKKKPGFFADVRSDDLGVVVVQALVRRTGVDPASVDDVVIGTPTQIGEQANIGRDIALAAGLALHVPGIGVDSTLGRIKKWNSAPAQFL